MFVIGIDSHTDTLAGCVVDHLGAALECRNIANTAAGHRELVDWAQAWHPVRVAVEGSGAFGRPAAVAALRAGLDVREVPPQMTARLRRRGRTQTKSDQIDALVIAQIALRDDTLAAPSWWEDTEDLRVLVSYRCELVEDRTAQANRLHADLGKLRPGYQHNIPRLTSRKALDQALRLLWRDMTPHAQMWPRDASGLCGTWTDVSPISPPRSKPWSTEAEPACAKSTGSAHSSPPSSSPRSATPAVMRPKPSSRWRMGQHRWKPAPGGWCDIG